MESAGKWLENALVDLCQRVEIGLDLDRDVISGLVAYCELAQPIDAKEYLDNIVGQEAGKNVIGEYLRRRGYVDSATSSSISQPSKFQAYVKPATEKGPVIGAKKPSNASKTVTGSAHQAEPNKLNVPSNQADQIVAQSNSRKKKKSGKVISLEEAAKGSIVFQQGKPCSCQARRHRLVSNCLSCGKIVCEQEGEGPCLFCGALVLKEGSSYAGLEGISAPVSDAEAAAEAYAKRLVDYDRDAASRTTVIDDQSDYYETEGNSWLSKEEKELLTKKQEEIEAAEQAKRNKVIITFDLVGRKVLVNEDEVPELESENRILRPSNAKEKEVNRIKPNPSLKIQPIFLDPGPSKKSTKVKDKQQSKRNGGAGICLAITGRVQHDNKDMKKLLTEDGPVETAAPNGKHWHAPAVGSSMPVQDENECSLSYY
ncbi:Activating signal cointegrator 1 [Linum grandiflorum]